jgi:hypothetical protein
MGRTPPIYFSKANNCDATNRCDTNGGTWPWAMCLHISKKRSKPLVELSGMNQSFKSSYTIPNRSPNERRGKNGKIEINAFLSKIRSIFGWKCWQKGRSQPHPMDENGEEPQWVLADGVVKVLGANVCTVRTYSLTWVSACAWRNYANGGGIRSGAIVEDLWEANACALIVYSSYNVSQSPPMYQRKWIHISWWPFSPPHGGKW